jgi:hypothetical protein
MALVLSRVTTLIPNRQVKFSASWAPMRTAADLQQVVAHLLGVLGRLRAVAGEQGPGGVEGPAAVPGPLHRGDGAVDVGEGAVDLLGQLVQ